MATILLTEVMFLVMIVSFLPLSREIPRIGYLFLAYTVLITLETAAILCLETTYLKLKERYDI